MGVKSALKNIGKAVAGMATGGMSDVIFDAIEGKVKGSEAASEIAKLRRDPQVRAELAKIEADRDKAVAESAAQIIVAEAQSDNTLTKTARPGAIWAVTLLIFLNYLIPLITNLVIRIQAINARGFTDMEAFENLPNMSPEEIPAALFAVWATAIGGYIWARRKEKRDRLELDQI